jgi:hypothetical protein
MKKVSVLFSAFFIFTFFAFSSSLEGNSRIIIAVTKFKPIGVSDAVSEAVYEYVSSAVVKVNKYHVVERGLLEKIVKEAAFSHSDLAERSTAVKLGKLLSASQVIVGKIIRLGSSYSISARLVNVINARIISSEIVRVQNFSELGEACTNLTYKLINAQGSASTAPALAHYDFDKGIVGTWKIVKRRYSVYISFYRNKVFKEIRIYYRRGRPVKHIWQGKYVIRNRVLGLFARNLRWLDNNFLLVNISSNSLTVKILGNRVDFERVR